MITLGPEWRNWQTQETQNLPPVTRRVGSIPSSGTTRRETHFHSKSGGFTLREGSIPSSGTVTLRHATPARTAATCRDDTQREGRLTRGEWCSRCVVRTAAVRAHVGARSDPPQTPRRLQLGSVLVPPTIDAGGRVCPTPKSILKACNGHCADRHYQHGRTG